MRLLGPVIGLVLLALPVPALADDDYAVPYDGYRHPMSSWPNAVSSEMISFSIYADYADGEFDVEVATSPDADPDGTLADANRIDAYVAPMDPRVTEGVFTAHTRLDAAWLSTLGTYYWQAYRLQAGAVAYSTPVQRITVVERPPPDAPSDPAVARTTPTPSMAPVTPAEAYPLAKQLSRGSAKVILRRTIKTQSGRRPRRMKSSCRLPTPYLADCRLRWSDARHRYRVSARLESMAAGMLATLDGTRQRRACARRCRSAIHWSIATAS